MCHPEKSSHGFQYIQTAMNPDDIDNKLTLCLWSSHSMWAETFHDLVNVESSLPYDLREESDGFSSTHHQERKPNREAFTENSFSNDLLSEWINEVKWVEFLLIFRKCV